MSSKQSSSATGPQDFKVQWSLDGTTWTDLPGATVKILIADSFPSGTITDIPLPVDLENQPNVYLRWILTSNYRVGSEVLTMLTAGTNRIDDINITGAAVDIVSWRFEDAIKSAAADFVTNLYTADDGILPNKDIAEIQVNGGPAFFTWVLGPGGGSAPSTNGWDVGAGTKYWSTSFSTTGYKDLQLFSKQSGSTTGPRDFKVQWSLNGTTWADVAGASVTVANNWTSGVLSGVPLPYVLENQSTVHLRWIMTSDINVSGGAVVPTGTNRMDDIFIGGRLMGVLPETTVRTGLVAYWPFDIDTNDYSGNNNHGTNHGAVSAPGKISGGYSFSALNAYVGVPQSATLSTALIGGDFTMSFWGTIPSNTDVAMISQSPGPGPTPKWMFAVQDFGTKLGFYSWGDDIVERKLATYTFTTHADLQYYTLVRRDSNWFLYKNADKVGYSLEGPFPLADLGMDFEIARAEGAFYYKQVFDEFMIWDRALTYDEIEYMYNGGTGVSLMPSTLTYTAGPNGSITGVTPQTVNHGTDGTAVTAVADPGYHFVDWSDASTDNPRTDLLVTSDITVTANFAINTYTLTYTAGPNGSITGVTPQTVNHGTDGTAVTAVADPGYLFVDWSDASVSNPRTDLAVTGDITVTANFAVIPPAGGPVTPIAGGRRPGDTPVTPDPTQPQDPTVPPEDADSPFTDIADHWAEEYIKEIYDLGYINGYNDDTFRPDATITRAEASKIIALWFGEEIGEDACEEDMYRDVDCDEWYGKYIGFLTKKGILSGYIGQDIFRPDRNISMAEAVKIMVYAKGMEDSSILGIINPFILSEQNDWFYTVLIIAYKYGIISIEEGVSFDPNAFITRAEFVKLFYDTLIRE